MSDDFDYICNHRPHKDFSIKELLDTIQKEKQVEYEKLTYFQKEKRKSRIREAKKLFKINFSEINVSKEVGEFATKLRWRINCANDMTNYWKDIYLEREDKAFDKNNIEALEEIYDEVCQPIKERNLNFYKNKILKSIGCDISEINPMLNEIKNDNEADIVLACVEGSDWITKLEKNYPSRLAKMTYSDYTYKDQIRLHRRMLEKDLKKVGVIDRRAQKISQILLSI